MRALSKNVIRVLFLSVICAFFLMASLPSFTFAQTRSDCKSTNEAGKKKMEQEDQKEEERQKETSPDPEETNSSFEQCLGGINGAGGIGGGIGGFPPLPTFEDIINGVCQEARKKVSEKVGGLNFITDVGRGNNYVRPNDGGLNQDIWSALQ